MESDFSHLHATQSARVPGCRISDEIYTVIQKYISNQRDPKPMHAAEPSRADSQVRSDAIGNKPRTYLDKRDSTNSSNLNNRYKHSNSQKRGRGGITAKSLIRRSAYEFSVVCVSQTGDHLPKILFPLFFSQSKVHGCLQDRGNFNGHLVMYRPAYLQHWLFQSGNCGTGKPSAEPPVCSA